MDIKGGADFFKNKISSTSVFKKDGVTSVKKVRFVTLSALEKIKKEEPIFGEPRILLVPFKTLVLSPFSFPFGRKGKVRDALRLTFRPILGERESMLSVVPHIAEQTSNLTRGSVWFAAKSEIEETEALAGKDFIFWPAPLAFIPERDGCSLVIYCDDAGYSAMLFENKEPIFYRWMPFSDGDGDSLAEWMRSYAESVGKPVSETEIFRDTEELSEALCRKQSLSSNLKSFENFDLSNRGVDIAREIESFTAAAFSAIKIFTVLGAVFALLSLALMVQTSLNEDTFGNAPSAIYKASFGEESRSPISSSSKKLRLITGEGVQMTLEQTLSNFSAAWKNCPEASNITMDSVRYGTERTEIQGLADGMTSIQALSGALEKNGFTSKVGDVQQVPGSGMRFSLTLTGAGK